MEVIHEVSVLAEEILEQEGSFFNIKMLSPDNSTLVQEYLVSLICSVWENKRTKVESERKKGNLGILVNRKINIKKYIVINPENSLNIFKL